MVRIELHVPSHTIGVVFSKDRSYTTAKTQLVESLTNMHTLTSHTQGKIGPICIPYVS